MDKSYVFTRGQVWYWDDPIYGRKDQHEEVSPWDATVRFSRYVLVVQTTESINPVSVLVLPCSSGNKTERDVPVPINHVSHENTSYARTALLFPAHPKCLRRYICTLSDSTMRKIDEKLLDLLIPGSASIAPSDDVEVVVKKNTRRKWDDASINKFINVYREEGIESACNEFKLMPASAKKYYIQWNKQATAALNQTQAVNIDVNDLGILKTNDAPFVVSNIANLIKDGFKETLLFEEVRSHLIDVDKSSEDFYKEVGSSVYHTLLSFLEIRREFGEFVIPRVDKTSGNIGTWIFLDRIYNDENLQSISDANMLMQAYIHYYGDNQDGIDYDWLSLLYQKLMTKVGIREDGATVICDKIDKTFCTINKINKAS